MNNKNNLQFKQTIYIYTIIMYNSQTWNQNVHESTKFEFTLNTKRNNVLLDCEIATPRWISALYKDEDRKNADEKRAVIFFIRRANDKNNFDSFTVIP